MTIYEMKEEDRQELLRMMDEFYHSDAVITDGSIDIYNTDIDECLKGEYLKGYTFKLNNTIVGYAMVPNSFSTEKGVPVKWIQDIYIDTPYRGKGYGRQFFQYLYQVYPHHIFLLDVEKENTQAYHLYESEGFTESEYIVMRKGLK